MRRAFLVAAAVSVVSVMGAWAAPIALAYPNATCDASHPLTGGDWGNVTAGPGCSIGPGTHIHGNLTVVTGGSLDSFGAVIDGNLQADHALYTSVFGGSIGGNFQVTATSDGFTGPQGSNNLCATRVQGNVIIQSGGPDAAWTPCGAQTSVMGNLTFQSNQGSAGLDNYDVLGNVTVQSNTGGGELVGNHAHHNCTLASNNPPWFAGGNTVDGSNHGC